MEAVVVVHKRRPVEMPDVEGLWALAACTDLPADARARIDGALAWALGQRPGHLEELALIRLAAGPALADGAFDERELRLLVRALLRLGCASEAEWREVRRTLEQVGREVAIDGAQVVAVKGAQALSNAGAGRVALRLSALTVAADLKLRADELGAWRALVEVTGATAGEARDALSAAASLYARLP